MRKLKRILKVLMIFYIAFVLLAACMFGTLEKREVVFDNDACIIPVTKYTYKTCADILFVVDGHEINVPKGFHSDLASIPRIYWPVLAPQHASFVRPAILHDFMYYCPDYKSRRYVDDVFFWALRQEGVSDYTAFKMWAAVRLFGGSHFNRDGACLEHFE